MKWYNTLALVALCVVIGLAVWVISHPAKEVVVLQGTPLPPGPPDVRYVERWHKAKALPATETLRAVEDSTAQDSVDVCVAEKTFTRESLFGPILSRVVTWSLAPVLQQSDSIGFVGGEKAAMDRIKKQVASELKGKGGKTKAFLCGTVAGVAAAAVIVIATN